MSQLEKARIEALKPSAAATAQGQATPQADLEDAFDVQFNPASLRLQLSNSLEGGTTHASQARQNLGTGSSVLSFDLAFDTADEVGPDGPLSVREKTRKIEQFVVPKGAGEGQEAPPRLRFRWGDLIVTGVMESLSLDMDFFASNGVPLRAKMSVTIKGQDERFEVPAPAGQPGPTPGSGSGAPGSSGSGGSQSAPALAGESAADFAARMGLDPSAWRGLAGGLEGTLSLEAGAEIGFSAGLSAGVGLGASVGVEAGVSASLDASFGLEASAGASLGGSFGASLGAGVSLSAGASFGAAAGLSLSGAAGGSVSASAGASAGFALAAAGGFQSAVESVRTVRVEGAAAQARASFGTPPPAALAAASAGARSGAGAAPLPSARASAAPTPAIAGATAAARPTRPDQPRPRLNTPRPTARAQAAPAPRPPRADPRAVSFGFGVPLRPRAAPPPGVPATDGVVVLEPRAPGALRASAPDPTAPPWTYLPAETKAPRAPAAHGGGCGCGCNGGAPRRKR